MVDQQLQLAKRLLIGRGRLRFGSRNAARATASASIGSDLPRDATRTSRRRHQLRRHPDELLTRGDERPLKLAGQLPAILERPQPLERQAMPTRRADSLARPLTVSSATSGRPRRRRPPSATACARPLRSRSFRSPPPTSGATGERTGLNRGSCQAPIKSRSAVSGRRRRHNAGKSALGATCGNRVSRRRPESASLTGRHTSRG